MKLSSLLYNINMSLAVTGGWDTCLNVLPLGRIYKHWWKPHHETIKEALNTSVLESASATMSHSVPASRPTLTTVIVQTEIASFGKALTLRTQKTPSHTEVSMEAI